MNDTLEVLRALSAHGHASAWLIGFLMLCLSSHRQGSEPAVWFLLKGIALIVLSATAVILAIKLPREQLYWLVKAITRRQ